MDNVSLAIYDRTEIGETFYFSTNANVSHDIWREMKGFFYELYESRYIKGIVEEHVGRIIRGYGR